MPTTQIVPVNVGDVVYDHLSTAVAHIQSAQFFVTQRDHDAVARWIEEATTDLRAASAALVTGEARELRRPVEVTELIEAVDL